jgi:hypothetical protein
MKTLFATLALCLALTVPAFAGGPTPSSPYVVVSVNAASNDCIEALSDGTIRTLMVKPFPTRLDRITFLRATADYIVVGGRTGGLYPRDMVKVFNRSGLEMYAHVFPSDGARMMVNIKSDKIAISVGNVVCVISRYFGLFRALTTISTMEIESIDFSFDQHYCVVRIRDQDCLVIALP